MRRRGNAFIGTSGWNYKHWANGIFYPRGLAMTEWLRYFSRTFGTVEINSSFYRLPTAAAFAGWREQVPEDFTFSVKASRFLTHIKRLKDPEDPLALFFSRASHLGNRLGPVLFQLPPQFKCDPGRLDRFLAAIRMHAAEIPRTAIEFRHSSWLNERVFTALADHGVALCFADWHDLPVGNPVTANFVYIRRHGGTASGSNYTARELNQDASRIESWLTRDKHDVYVYFNNDLKGYAVRNALSLRNRLEKRTRAA
jgi:uncharacterized protein YecE (DUF72 family)